MNKKIILVTAIALATFVAIPIFAQTESLSKIIATADKLIAQRVLSLNNLSTRITNAKKITDEQKKPLLSSIQNQITQLNNLKAKIDADKDVATAKADTKSIADSLRIYALIMPQIQIIGASDRVMATAENLARVQLKMQARIDVLKTKTDTTALQQYSDDLKAKIADANAQAVAAITEVSNLVPDNGVKTVQQSNTATLKSARNKLKIATEDLTAARKDAGNILKALKEATKKIIPGTTKPTK